MKTFLLALLFLLPTAAFANNTICKQKSGALYVRPKCLKGETTLSQTTLANLGIATTNSILSFQNCHENSPAYASACTVDTNSVEHCTFSCPTNEFILTAAATPTNFQNYSLGPYITESLSNGIPLTEEFVFYATAQSGYSIIGTCCPLPG